MGAAVLASPAGEQALLLVGGIEERITQEPLIPVF